jgi:hypothetical protein
MKKNILCLIIALSLTATTFVFAQPPGNSDQRAQMQQMMKQYLKDSLQLSDAMTDSVMAVRMEFHPKMREIFMNQSLSADEKESKIGDIRTQMEARYKAVGLTDDQVKKLVGKDQRMREQMHNRMNNGGTQ